MNAACYVFALPPGWGLERDDVREHIAAQMASVLGVGAVIAWDMDERTVTVEVDLNGRRTLEALAMVVQAFNSAYVHVTSWPGAQTCSPDGVGGVETVPTAVGSVDCVSFGPAAD